MTVEQREKFGNLLLQKRKEKGMKQFDCAKMMGVSVVTWRLWESGVTNPRKGNMEKIMEVFGISEEEFC